MGATRVWVHKALEGKTCRLDLLASDSVCVQVCTCPLAESCAPPQRRPLIDE